MRKSVSTCPHPAQSETIAIYRKLRDSLATQAVVRFEIESGDSFVVRFLYGCGERRNRKQQRRANQRSGLR
jgi:hypothetical protein